MCAIIGFFGFRNAIDRTIDGLIHMRNRGQDGCGICGDNWKQYAKNPEGLHIKSSSTQVMGHLLHAMINEVQQPLIKDDKRKIVANCEIYNWKELSRRINVTVQNDAELLLEILAKPDLTIQTAIEMLYGPFAFAYWEDDHLTLARDKIGIKPLWYYEQNGKFAFTSEKRALMKVGIYPRELNPRIILDYNIKTGELRRFPRSFFSIIPELMENLDEIVDKTTQLLTQAVENRLANHKIGVLFSGGIDSTLIAYILKQKEFPFYCYAAAASENAQDLHWAKKVAKELDFPLKYKIIKQDQVPTYLKKIVLLLQDSNVVKVGAALTFFPACELAQRDGVKYLFSGLGADELFGGYFRHKMSPQVNLDCLSDIRTMYEKNTSRDDLITMENQLELRVPFLDQNLIEYALRIPEKYKIKGDETKIILRHIAKAFEIPVEIVNRPKKAAQYGSKVDEQIARLARTKNLSKSQLLFQFYPQTILKLGALVSSGKDSLYALHLMRQRNYAIHCLISVRSQNPYSWMFHTPNIELVHLQAQALGIPLVFVETRGEKEQELQDLQHAIQQAIEKYQIEGVISGALYSNYQRTRIEQIADLLDLKVFSPLWHTDQEREMRQLVEAGFEVIFSSVASMGLNKSWLGKIITHADIDKLKDLNKKIGLNIAGEGGEYESLVLYGPGFSHRIVIDEYETIEENSITAKTIIKKAHLEEL
ncbi:MAG: diphthine--ammonia ligase [Candidatus Hodarchaeota archaeon]